MIRLPTKGGTEYNKTYHGYYYKAIDLEEISTPISNKDSSLSIETSFYIEKFLDDTEEESYSLTYPLPSTISTYQKPYLTPERHRDYAIFWGSCTSIGTLILAVTWLKKIK